MCLESYVWESSSRSGFSNSALSGPRDSTDVPPGPCAVRTELWWVVPAHSCLHQRSSIISFQIFSCWCCRYYLLYKSLLQIFFRLSLETTVWDTWSYLFIVPACIGEFLVFSSAQTKRKASKPFMKVNFKNSYPPPLFKLAGVFPYLMIENSTSFFKPSPGIGRGEIDPQFAGSRTLPFTPHTISTWVLCTQKSSCVVFVCLWLVCAPGVPCTLKQWGCQWDDSLCVCAERGVVLTHWTNMCDEAHSYLPHSGGVQLAIIGSAVQRGSGSFVLGPC